MSARRLHRARRGARGTHATCGRRAPAPPASRRTRPNTVSPHHPRTAHAHRTQHLSPRPPPHHAQPHRHHRDHRRLHHPVALRVDQHPRQLESVRKHLDDARRRGHRGRGRPDPRHGERRCGLDGARTPRRERPARLDVRRKRAGGARRRALGHVLCGLRDTR